MRTLLLALLLLVLSATTACQIQADPAHWGTKITATANCGDPQTGYHTRNVGNLDQLGLSAWLPQTDLTQHVDLTFSCDDFTHDCLDLNILSACGTQSGYYDLGTNTAHVDNSRANGEFAWSGVTGHEAIHWQIAGGPHPERARLHVCACGETATECWTGGCDAHAWMAPNLAGLGSSTHSSWNGNVEDIGELTTNTPTNADREFVRWAITP